MPVATGRALDEALDAALPEAPPGHPARRALRAFAEAFDDPAAVVDEVRRVRAMADAFVAPGARFLERPASPNHDTWEYPITLWSLLEVERGILLALPPGSRRFAALRAAAPRIVEEQLQAVFPRLVPEISNRPNLFFPGVFFPHEIGVRNVEMISARHGTFYVSEVELDLAGEGEPARVVAKPADMGVEAIATHTIRDLNRRMKPAVRERIGPIAVPTTVSIAGRYGVMERVPGRNGVEFLPQGVATGGIPEFDRLEYPAALDLERDDVLAIGREFAKQAVMAFYLRLYDRKPDQLMIHRGPDGRLRFTHLDFGRGVKRRYALPWKRHYDPHRPAIDLRDHEIPYLEAASAILYLPHFIPARYRGDLDPWAGDLRAAIVETFVGWAAELKANADVVLEWYRYLVGQATQYRPHEVPEVAVVEEDIAAVRDGLLALDDPREAIEAILALARHERRGTTPVEEEEAADASSPYMRALESGPRTTRLAPACDSPPVYRLRDPREAGVVLYDPDARTLSIAFGRSPDRAIERVAAISRALAAWIRSVPGPKENVVAEIAADGAVEVRAGPLVRRDLRLPDEVVRDLAGALSGRAPPPHVVDLAEAYRAWRRARPEADYLRREVEKASLVMANDLAGREILQFYLAQEERDSPLRPALEEMIGFLLSNPDFLVDKDPFDTINQYVVSLGRKHRFVAPLRPEDLPADLRGEPVADAALRLYAGAGEAEVVRLELGPHRVHLEILVRFADEIARRAGLDAAERRRLLLAALLHDLSVLDPAFRRVVMEPCGRSWAPFVEEALDRHAEIAVRVIDSLGDRLPLPAEVRADIRALVASHHRGGTPAAEILHLADNLAVFGDQTRPDNWIRGAYGLGEIAPRWIDAQRERGLVSEGIHRAARAFFADAEARPLLRALDEVSAPYVKCFNALHLAAMLRWGLHPHHPGLLEELRERHGRARVDRIWATVLRSDLTVREKVQIIYRIHDIAPMFEAEGVESYAFVNASARPVQRTVETVEQFLAEGRTAILVGFFPRVVKTYERLVEAGISGEALDRVVGIAGEMRLQFVRYSFPHEARFEVPFHRVIRRFRQERGAIGRTCLIPLRRFFEARSDEAAPAGDRYLALGKADDVPEADSVVEAEAGRYRTWYATAPVGSFDAPERERFRRIILDGFQNRDVLLFYRATLPAGSALEAPLGEVIGALRENPNYLVDRSHYYGIHELVRSLSLIHFPQASRAGLRDRVEAVARGLGLGIDDIAGLLEPPRGEVAFGLQTFVSAIEIAHHLARSFPGADRRRLARWIAAASALVDDPAVGAYLLSPEDMATNATLRASLLEAPRDLAGRIAARAPDVAALSNPATPGDEVLHAIAQTALYLAHYADESRIENWRRAKIDIGPEDIREVGGAWLGEIGPRLAPPLRAALAAALDDLGRPGGEGIDLLNRIAGLGDDYLILYNALTVAAELRWGLQPRGLDVVGNVRMMYGTRVTEMILDGIFNAQMPPRDKVKFARKLRMWADALRPEAEAFDEVRFLNADSIAALARVEEVRAVLGGRVLFVLAGSHEKASVVFGRVADGLGASDRAALGRNLRVLVGEDQPVLMKEKTTLLTEEIGARIRAWRAGAGVGRRVALAPAEVVLDLGAVASPPFPRPEATPADSALDFFRAWVRRFE